MSSMNMYKAITPLDYLGPEVEIRTTSDIKREAPFPNEPSHFVWYAKAGTRTIAHEYTANRVVLMDDLRITEETAITTSGGSVVRSDFDYWISLNNSNNQIINKYCRFQFSFTFNGAGINTLIVELNVVTPWKSGPKCINLTYSNLTSGTKVSPYLFIDWSDSSVIYYTV